jgi:hypothetical protein
MDAIQERNHDSGFGKANPEDGGTEFEGYGGFLLCVIPDDKLDGNLVSAYSDSEWKARVARTLFWGNLGFRPPPTIAR